MQIQISPFSWILLVHCLTLVNHCTARSNCWQDGQVDIIYFLIHAGATRSIAKCIGCYSLAGVLPTLWNCGSCQRVRGRDCAAFRGTVSEAQQRSGYAEHHLAHSYQHFLFFCTIHLHVQKTARCSLNGSICGNDAVIELYTATNVSHLDRLTCYRDKHDLCESLPVNDWTAMTWILSCYPKQCPSDSSITVSYIVKFLKGPYFLNQAIVGRLDKLYLAPVVLSIHPLLFSPLHSFII